MCTVYIYSFLTHIVQYSTLQHLDILKMEYYPVFYNYSNNCVIQIYTENNLSNTVVHCSTVMQNIYLRNVVCNQTLTTRLQTENIYVLMAHCNQQHTDSMIDQMLGIALLVKIILLLNFMTIERLYYYLWTNLSLEVITMMKTTKQFRKYACNNYRKGSILFHAMPSLLHKKYCT